MSTAFYDSKRLKKATRLTCVLLAIMLVFTVMQWGIASSWGDITINRVTFVGEGGSQQSGLLFVPNGVDASNPAPAIVNYHGRNNSSYNLINWGIEQARRGYIAFNPDLAGTLETSLKGDNSTENLALSPIRYISSLEMVSEVSVTAHSMGNLSLQVIEGLDDTFQPKLKNLVGVGGAFFYAVTGAPFTTNTNHAVIEGSADLYEYYIMGGIPNVAGMVQGLAQLPELENGVVYGDPAAGTAFMWEEIEDMTHHGVLYNKETMASMFDFINLSSPAPVQLAGDDMVHWGYLICSAIAFMAFLFFIPAFAYFLTSLPCFYNAVNIPLVPSQGKSKKKWALHGITDFLIPLALFVPVTAFGKNFPTDFFCSLWVNQIFLWLISISLIGLVLLVIKYYKKSRTEKLTAADFGFGAADEKMFNGKRIGAAALITFIVAFVCYSWLGIVSSLTGLNYQFFSTFGQIVKMNPERYTHILRYMIMMIPVYFMTNVNVATSRRVKDTGNELVDTTKSVLVNMLLSAGTLTAMVLIQFGSIRLFGDGSSVFSQDKWDAISFGWTFPITMSAAAGISSYLHRKTGNVWVGMLVSWTMILCINILSCCLVPAANVK
jgi:hypothetical protein